MRQIPLSQGKYSLVDDADFPELSKFKWYAAKSNNTFYAVRNIPLPGKQKQTRISIHQMILGYSPSNQIDHKDGNGLNNQRKNLRIVTRAQNLFNKRKYKTNTTGFKGVRFSKFHGKFQAQIQAGGVKRHLGYFFTAEKAYAAYKIAAVKFHGEFARFA